MAAAHSIPFEAKSPFKVRGVAQHGPTNDPRDAGLLQTQRGWLKMPARRSVREPLLFAGSVRLPMGDCLSIRLLT